LSVPSDIYVGQPLEVKVYNNLEKAIKAFRALVQKEKILSTYKEKSRYEKPSDRNRRKKNEARRKLMELDYKYKNFDKFVDKKNNKEEE